MSVTIPTITLGGQVANLSRAADDGTVNTGVTAVETKSGLQHATKLTFSALAVAPIVGAADEAVGKLLYTLPVGAILVRAAHMNVALTDTADLIDADTPEVGLGTTIGSGANATLGAVDAAAENIIVGQVADDVNGTYLSVGITNQGFVIPASGDKGVYLNVADGWAGADAGLKVSGSVVLEWVSIS